MDRYIIVFCILNYIVCWELFFLNLEIKIEESDVNGSLYKILKGISLLYINRNEGRI